MPTTSDDADAEATTDADRPDPDERAPTAGSAPASDAWSLRGGDRDEVLGLLHANGRAIVDRLAAMGPITLVLDECHHLLQLWGHVLEAVIGALDPASVVVGLTATPPDVLSERERALHGALFGGRADFQVVTPAVVKDGYLAPYQELALVVAPHGRRAALHRAGAGTLRPAALGPARPRLRERALRCLVRDARSSPAARPMGSRSAGRSSSAPIRSWPRPRSASAGSRAREPPRGARFREQHRRPPGTDDWMALMDGYVRDVLDVSRRAGRRGRA